MDNFYWLHQIQPSDREIVGNQAFDLSRLIQQDLPVLSGIVIPATQFWEFLETIDWREPFFVDLSASSLYLDSHDSQNLQQIAQGIRHQILTSTLPSDWLSQFTEILQQWSAPALIFQSYLRGSESSQTEMMNPVFTEANPRGMGEGLKQAWAEFFRASSLFYWDHQGLALQQLQPIILVRPLYQPIASGTIQIDATAWQIQAVPGLKLSLDWGQTEPDDYHIHPQTHQIQSQKLGHKTLTYQLKSLSTAGLNQPQKAISHPTIPLPTDLANTPLQAEILPENQQTTWALEPSQLQTLIQLTHHFTQTKLAKIAQLHWLLCSPSMLAGYQFYWTAFYPQRSPSTHLLSPLKLSTDLTSSVEPFTPSSLRLSGLGVSGEQVIAPAWVFSSTLPQPTPFSAGSILVIPQITADYFPLLKQAGGVVAEQGSMTSHGAILARELGIPAVLGVPDATQQIQTGETVFINGRQGEVHLLGIHSSVTPLTKDLSPTFSSRAYNISTPIATHLMVNISQSHTIKTLQQLPIDGIGLLRSELLALDVLTPHPDTGKLEFQQWLQPELQSEFVQKMAEGLRLFCDALSLKPIFYRALDLRDFYGETRPFWGETAWEYLILRQRIHRQYFSDQNSAITLFDLELAVLSQLHQWGYSNIKLILPFVRSVEEFSAYHYWVKQAGLMENSSFQLWIMAEVPSVLFLLPDYVQAGVEGIAIGTNDLTQLLLGVERNRHQTSTQLNAAHPAMIAAIQKLIKLAQMQGIPCSICGDAPVLYPELIPQLIQAGITAISVQVDAVESTYRAIAKAEKSILLQEVRRQSWIDYPGDEVNQSDGN